MGQIIDTYITVTGDTWDLISYKVYGTEKMMENLILANPKLSKVVIFDGDITIICPEIPAQKAGDLPSWVE